eukprot:CAMPEP_0178401644 /NCGR_PEP_ID=MMETSP0689_2-20121128/16411_1 /TAXON_ID=160604 /ORGANISM="Amphidinium massartii, Strain CS-259" /LENGTH=546 /DNA_ID=CAMNT_0020022477 /DNA_START=109 /DNA_END=1749 /DNA_ORIENTATION=-
MRHAVSTAELAAAFEAATSSPSHAEIQAALAEQNSVVHGAASCPPGDTEEVGCVSLCRWINLTNWTSSNGQCEEFVEQLVAKGYSKPRFWKLFRARSDMEPVIKILTTNCLESERDFYLLALLQLVEKLDEKEKEQYSAPLDLLQQNVVEIVAPDILNPATNDADEDDDEVALPECAADMKIHPGDILTTEVGGPNMAEVSKSLSKTAAEHESLQLRRHFNYGLRYEYSATYSTSTNTTWEERDFKSKTKRFFELAWKHTANTMVRVGKGMVDFGINFGKGVADLTMNIGKALGKFFVYSGAAITKTYANQRQTTPHTGHTLWTHSELAVDVNHVMSAYGGIGVTSNSICSGGRVHLPTGEGKVIISRFSGDGTVDADAYATLAAERAQMWQPYLHHYADTVGQWHRAVVGKCKSMFGTPGDSDYFEAVSDAKVKEMWDYSPSSNETEEAFYEGIVNSFRTHKQDIRVKPKAMFCSKFVSAVWSSTIGNPTDLPDAEPRKQDLKDMLPLNPGACSPWTVVQWLLSKRGRRSWKSCLADTKTWDPCA